MYQSSQGLREQRQRLIINISKNNPPKWWAGQKQQLFNARLLSISTGRHIFSLSKAHTYTVGNLHNIDSLSHRIPFFLQMNSSCQIGATFKHPKLRF